MQQICFLNDSNIYKNTDSITDISKNVDILPLLYFSFLFSVFSIFHLFIFMFLKEIFLAHQVLSKHFLLKNINVAV